MNKFASTHIKCTVTTASLKQLIQRQGFVTRCKQWRTKVSKQSGTLHASLTGDNFSRKVLDKSLLAIGPVRKGDLGTVADLQDPYTCCPPCSRFSAICP